MSKQYKGVNKSRLKTIYLRQDSPSWGTDYIPSILATPQEAPAISHAVTMTPSKLNGRETHLLSISERNACLLGLYNPQVIGLQEQRMLSPEPCHHPLWSFPGVDRTVLPPLNGIIDVADRLQYLDLLTRLNVEDRNTPGNLVSVVFPWVGDLLWSLKGNTGKFFNVNWSIKGTYLDFKRPSINCSGKAKETRRVLGRHEIEKIYYQDAGIRTVLVANEGIDRHVSANLRQLFLHHRRPLHLTVEQREEILKKYHSALEIGIPPIEVIIQFSERGRYTVDQCRSLLWQAIWDRELRVDLFKPILINRPLMHEIRDVIDVYSDWFKE